MTSTTHAKISESLNIRIRQACLDSSVLVETFEESVHQMGLLADDLAHKDAVCEEQGGEISDNRVFSGIGDLSRSMNESPSDSESLKHDEYEQGEDAEDVIGKEANLCASDKHHQSSQCNANA